MLKRELRSVLEEVKRLESVPPVSSVGSLWFVCFVCLSSVAGEISAAPHSDGGSDL